MERLQGSGLRGFRTAPRQWRSDKNTEMARNYHVSGTKGLEFMVQGLGWSCCRYRLQDPSPSSLIDRQ